MSWSVYRLVALMDTKENVEGITRFFNNHQRNRIYVNVEGDYFFTERRPYPFGWALPPIRSNYVEKQLKMFISSGIFTHLKSVYNIWKPAKLLGQYANWRYPKIEAVSRLNFSSKVTAGFYVCGICLIICVLAFVAEFVRYKYNLKYIYWFNRLLSNFMSLNN